MILRRLCAVAVIASFRVLCSSHKNGSLDLTRCSAHLDKTNRTHTHAHTHTFTYEESENKT